MPIVTIEEHIEVSPQRVWDFVSDIRRGPEWVAVMEEVLHVSDDPLKEGSRYPEQSKIGPGRSELSHP